MSQSKQEGCSVYAAHHDSHVAHSGISAREEQPTGCHLGGDLRRC